MFTDGPVTAAVLHSKQTLQLSSIWREADYQHIHGRGDPQAPPFVLLAYLSLTESNRCLCIRSPHVVRFRC